MDDGLIPRCILLAALIVGGGLFSGTETAIAYCNRIRFKLRAEEGERGALRVVKILDRYDNAITTLLIMINVIHIAAASIATVLAVKLWGASGSVISTVVMTLLVFFFSETLPKSIAKANADTFSSIVSLPLSVLMFLLTPLTFFFSKIGDLAKKLFGGGKKELSMTEDELHTIVENSEEEGGIEPEDSELIQSAIDFSDGIAADIMTPADRMVAINVHDTPDAVLHTILMRKYSRIPVTDGKNYSGVLQVRKYLRTCIDHPSPALRPLLSPPTFVRAQTPVHTLFEDMRRKKVHMCLIQNDDRKVIGLVTMEDILEELVGDIMDEDDKPEELMEDLFENAVKESNKQSEGEVRA